VDFTSRPTARKPITCAEGHLEDRRLQVKVVRTLADFSNFEALLREEGPWVAGFDFPFGLPHKLLDAWGWAGDWAEYVREIGTWSMPEFCARLAEYKADRPEGDKEHRRVTDEIAGSVSPMKLYGVPVGRMLQRGAPCLLRADVSIVPCRLAQSPRVALEAYPALVVRNLVGRRSYKTEKRADDTTERQAVRKSIVHALRSETLVRRYGFAGCVDRRLAEEAVSDWTGDRLDAILCSVQAAWGYIRRRESYGVPPGHEDEGWIVDPLTLERLPGPLVNG
jgi:hypothetical protein